MEKRSQPTIETYCNKLEKENDKEIKDYKNKLQN